MNATPAKGHIPFPGHRAQAEVRHDEEKREELRDARRLRATEFYYRLEQLPWCPVPYRDLNRELRSKGFGEASRREMIEQQIEVDSRRGRVP